MRASEILSNKLEELLGSNYKLFPVSHFNRNYTEAREVREGENIGYAYYPTSEYGKFRKDKVVGVVTLSGATRSNANGYYLSSNYSIQFSVPRNIDKTNKYGILNEQNTFNFDEDIDELINTIINSKIEFTGDFKGKLTMSEPSYVLTETDGEFFYDIMQVSGLVVISDNAIFGGDYKVEFGIDGEYIELDGVNTFSEIFNADANAIVKQGKARLEQNLAQTSWACTISLDDVQTENEARQKIYDIVHSNLEVINENAETEALKRKLPVRITTPSGVVHNFNAIVSITFTTSRNGVGSLDISLTDDNKG